MDKLSDLCRAFLSQAEEVGLLSPTPVSNRCRILLKSNECSVKPSSSFELSLIKTKNDIINNMRQLIMKLEEDKREERERERERFC